MGVKFYTEVKWNIEINEKHGAIHNLSIELISLSDRTPSLHRKISITLPSGQTFKDFKTKVNGISFLPGYGFVQKGENRYYELNLDDLADLIDLAKDNNIDINKSPVNIEISFEQGNIVKEIFDSNFIDIDFAPRFYSSGIELTISLPKRKFLERCVAIILNKGKSAYEIFTIEGPQAHKEKGGDIIQYNFEEAFRRFGLAFKFRKLDKASSIFGSFFMAVIASLVAALFIKMVGSK